MVVDYLDQLPASARIRSLAPVGYAMVMAADRPDVTSTAAYCDCRHLLVTFAGDLVGYVDEALAGLGMTRRIALSVSNFAVVPYLLRGSDYVVTVPRYLAAVLAREPGLKACPLPFESPVFDVSIAWSLVADRDPGERLLRDALLDALGGAGGLAGVQC